MKRIILSVILGLAFWPVTPRVWAADNTVRVAVFTTDPYLIKILNETIKSIETTHPGLKVQLDCIPYNSFLDKITTQMVAGNAPDIISVEASQFVDLYLRDAFADLTPFFERDKMRAKDYYPSIMNRFSPGGKIFALPSDIAPVGLVYYNKKFFKEAGLPFPTSKWSWPEPFLSICKKLVKKDATGRTTRWAYADPYGPNAVAFLLSAGGDFVDNEEHPTRLTLDTPESMQAFRFRWDLMYDTHVSPTYSELQGFSFGAGVEDMFMNGQVAMMASGVWHTPRFLQKKGLDFDVVEFPKGPKGGRGWQSGGTGYAVWKGSKNKEKAWEVLKEIVGEALVTEVVSTGMIQPALIKVAKSDAFLKSPGAANKKILLNMPKYSHFSPFVKNWSEIWNGQVGPALDPAWIGKKKPEEVLPKLTSEINKKYFGTK